MTDGAAAKIGVGIEKVITEERDIAGAIAGFDVKCPVDLLVLAIDGRSAYPVDHTPSSDSAIERGLRAIAAFGHKKSRLPLLHIGSESQFPDVKVPDGPWQVTRTVQQGSPVTEILDAAEEISVNLFIIVASTMSLAI